MKFVDDDDDDDDEATVMLFVPVQYERILYSLLTQRRDDVLTTSLVIAPMLSVLGDDRGRQFPGLRLT